MSEKLSEKKIDSYVGQLVKHIEKHELIKAPPNMQYEIMQKIGKQNHMLLKKPKNRAYKIQLIYYSMKVGIVASMALIVLFSADYKRSDKAPISKWQEEILGQMNEKTTQITSGLTSISNQILKMEVYKDEKKKK